MSGHEREARRCSQSYHGHLSVRSVLRIHDQNASDSLVNAHSVHDDRVRNVAARVREVDHHQLPVIFLQFRQDWFQSKIARADVR